jgi:hypothetical protein
MLTEKSGSSGNALALYSAGSNISLNTNYPHRDISWFASVPQGKFQVSISNQAKFSPVHYSLIILQTQPLTASLTKP